MEKYTFTGIPFELDVSVLNDKLKLRNKKQMLEPLEELMEQAKKVANPKAIYVEAPIEDRGQDYFILRGVKFYSSQLAGQLQQVDKVFPYVITSGVEIEEISEGLTDIFDQFLFDGIKSEILYCATDYVAKHIKDTYGYKEITYEIPGSLEGWDLQEQKKLFQIIGDTTSTIGVKLSDSNIMSPGKSVSGIYFQKQS